MKKAFKIGWLILILGLILTGIGYLKHGNEMVVFKGGLPQVIKQHDKLLSRNQKFKHLNLSATTADVRIQEGKQYQVKYYGMAGKIPTLTTHRHTMWINQKGHLQYAINLNSQANRDLIVITVPKGATLSGKIHLNGGNLHAVDVKFDQMKVIADSGNVNYDHVTLKGAKTRLASGDFNGQNLKIHGHYTVINEDGDNTVSNIATEGYLLETDNGDNELNGQNQGSRTLTQNENATNVLHLVTTDGDNEVN